MIMMLAINAIGLAVVMAALWLYSIRIRDVSFIDAFWAFGMAMLALSSFFQASGDPARQWLLTSLCLLWGLRLGSHLFTRWRAHGVDPRYGKILGHAMNAKGWSFGKAALIMVFAMQAPLLFIVCLPIQLGQLSTVPVGPQAAIGAIVAMIGIIFETAGDAQLQRHRANPAMAGKVLETGLWRYTRHPNYFGDACTWWGLYIIAAEASPGWWALPGPVLLTWLLTRLSGVPMLERSLKSTRPGYADYIRRTSSFFPLPPKR